MRTGCSTSVAVGERSASPRRRRPRRATSVLTEVNRRAARLAKKNLERNGLLNADVRVGTFFAPVDSETFDVIATNPPYRAGRPHVLRILAESLEHLAPAGRLVLVGKGSQGIRFYQEWLAEHWPGTVEVLARGSGYRVLEARRQVVGASPSPAKRRAGRRPAVPPRST